MTENEPNEVKNPHLDETVIVSRADLNAITQEVESVGPSGTGYAPEKRELLLIVRGMIERVMMHDGREIRLGRFEPATRHEDELDLTPYGAMDRGVSRYHAKIHLEGEQLYITDNRSTNGTYLANVRLAPETATILRKGDELILGRLPIQVMFR